MSVDEHWSIKWHLMSETEYKKVISHADFPSHNAQKMHLGASHLFSLQSVVEVQASTVNENKITRRIHILWLQEKHNQSWYWSKMHIRFLNEFTFILWKTLLNKVKARLKDLLIDLAKHKVECCSRNGQFFWIQTWDEIVSSLKI